MNRKIEKLPNYDAKCQIKGKSAIHIARNYLGKRKNYTGAHFWARGYHVSTVGRDEQTVRDYIRHQEQEDRRIDQLNLFK
jgi:putative transposase